MPMTPRSLVKKHYLRVSQRWPKDALRNLTFQDFVRQRIDKRIEKATDQPQENVKANDAQLPSSTTDDMEREMKQLNAMYSLLENRYKDEYPTSSKLLNPRFRPTYYADLAAELEAAPKRSWFARQWLRWSRIIRFS